MKPQAIVLEIPIPRYVIFKDHGEWLVYDNCTKLPVGDRFTGKPKAEAKAEAARLNAEVQHEEQHSELPIIPSAKA